MHHPSGALGQWRSSLIVLFVAYLMAGCTDGAPRSNPTLYQGPGWSGSAPDALPWQCIIISGRQADAGNMTGKVRLALGDEDDVQFQMKLQEPTGNGTMIYSMEAVVFGGLEVVSGETSLAGPLTRDGLIASFRVRAASQSSSESGGIQGRYTVDFQDGSDPDVRWCYLKGYEIE